MLLIKNARVWRNYVATKGWVGVGKNGLIDGMGHDDLPPESSYLSVLDANDCLLLPGLHDAHIHVMMTGESSHFVDLKGCISIAALQQQLRERIQQSEESMAWIQGVNWDQTPFGRYPTRHDLDAVSSTRPIFLWRACWHIGVANTKALELAGIVTSSGHMESSTVCPPGGIIDTYEEEDGVLLPSGILRERAVELVVAVMNTKTPTQCRQFIEKGLEMCVSHGLTSVQTNDEGCYSIYQQLQSDNKLPIRVFLTPNYDEIIVDATTPTTSATIATTSTPTTTPSLHGGMLLQPHRPSCMPRSTAFAAGCAVDGSGLETTSNSIINNNNGNNNNGKSNIDSDKASDGKSASSSSSSSSDPNSSVDTTSDIVAMSGASSSSLLIVERVKIFSDGSLGAETAALRTGAGASEVSLDNSNSTSITATTTANNNNDNDISPSPPAPPASFTGVLIHEAAALRHMISTARSLGFRVEIHAIGDAAAEQVLCAMETAGVCPSERPVLTHCQILGEDLVRQMKRLGVIANVQPSFVPTDMHWINKRGLSPVAWPYAYAWKTLLDAGVVVAGGSDAPIETCNPFVGIFDAMHRSARVPGLGPDSAGTGTPQDSVAASSAAVFRPEECLSFAEAVALYTTGAAVAAHAESFLGKIELGYFADFVVVDSAIVADPWLLQSVRPSYVIVGGKIVYEHGQLLRDDRTDIEGGGGGGVTGSKDEDQKSCSSTADPNTSPPGEAIGTRGLQSAAFFPGKGGAYNSFLSKESKSCISTDSDQNLPGNGISIINTTATATIATTTVALPGSGWTGRCACRLLGRYCGLPNAIRNRSNTAIDTNTITTSDSDTVLT